MSLESFMLKDEVKEVEYVASNRFVDKEGKVEKCKLKTITADENDAIRKQCYKQVQVGKRMKQEFDTVETNIRNDLTTSAETIDTADKNILDTLNQGNQ